MSNSLKKISRQQAKDALLKSGYLLENRLDSLLREYGYYPQSNTTFPDFETGKSRELDISAIWAEPAGPGEADFFFYDTTHRVRQ